MPVYSSLLYNNLFERHVTITSLYQLAFFTPGRFPAIAFIRNWNCKQRQPRVIEQTGSGATYTSQPKVAEDTLSSASHYTSVLDLCEPRVAVHFGELELGLCAHTLRERGITDDKAERVSR